MLGLKWNFKHAKTLKNIYDDIYSKSLTFRRGADNIEGYPVFVNLVSDNSKNAKTKPNYDENGKLLSADIFIDPNVQLKYQTKSNIFNPSQTIYSTRLKNQTTKLTARIIFYTLPKPTKSI